MDDQEEPRPEPEEDDLTSWYELTYREEMALAYDCVPSVDLSLAFSPVMGRVRDSPVEASRTQGRGYILVYRSPGQLPYTESISEEGLRFQRARYLVRRGYYALYMPVVPYYAANFIVRDYFNGYFLPIPEKYLPEQRRQWRLHLQNVLSSPPPTKNTFEGTIVSALLGLPQPKGEEGKA